MKLETQNPTFTILGTPKPSSGSGYMLFKDIDDTEHLVPPRELSSIQIGDNIGDGLTEKFGIRAVGMNVKFTYGNKEYYFRANLSEFIKALHLTSQGFTIDARDLLKPWDIKRKLPLPYALGDNVAYKGLYMGLWEPDQKLGTIFNVFAAPEDLFSRERNSYDLLLQDAVTEISKLSNWHGHDGAQYIIEDDLKDFGQEHMGPWIHPGILLAKLYKPELLSPYLREFLLKTNKHEDHKYVAFSKYTIGDGRVIESGWKTVILDVNKQKNFESSTIKVGRVRPVRLEPYEMQTLPKV